LKVVDIGAFTAERAHLKRLKQSLYIRDEIVDRLVKEHSGVRDLDFQRLNIADEYMENVEIEDVGFFVGPDPGDSITVRRAKEGDVLLSACVATRVIDLGSIHLARAQYETELQFPTGANFTISTETKDWIPLNRGLSQIWIDRLLPISISQEVLYFEVDSFVRYATQFRKRIEHIDLTTSDEAIELALQDSHSEPVLYDFIPSENWNEVPWLSKIKHYVDVNGNEWLVLSDIPDYMQFHFESITLTYTLKNGEQCSNSVQKVTNRSEFPKDSVEGIGWPFPAEVAQLTAKIPVGWIGPPI